MSFGSASRNSTSDDDDGPFGHSFGRSVASSASSASAGGTSAAAPSRPSLSVFDAPSFGYVAHSGGWQPQTTTPTDASAEDEARARQDRLAQAAAARASIIGPTVSPGALSLDPRSDAARDYPFHPASTEMQRGSMTIGGRPPADAPAPTTSPGFAVPGSYQDGYVAQGLSGVNEGIANVFGAPVDLVEMGLNGLSWAAGKAGVPDDWTPEFEGSFGGSDSIERAMGWTGSIVPESADPAKQAVRDGTEIAIEVVGTIVGAGLASRGVSATRAAEDLIAPAAGPRAVDLELTYKPGWSTAQRVEADQKVGALTEADTVVTAVTRSGTSASRRYQSAGGTVRPGQDVDHVQDLQLGGADEVFNMRPLDTSVNRSLGSQINHRISDLPVGTPVNRVTIGER